MRASTLRASTLEGQWSWRKAIATVTIRTQPYPKDSFGFIEFHTAELARATLPLYHSKIIIPLNLKYNILF